jgi:hypothetical protein
MQADFQPRPEQLMQRLCFVVICPHCNANMNVRNGEKEAHRGSGRH